MRQLDRLLQLVEPASVDLDPQDVTPVYDRADLLAAVAAAAEQFERQWGARLGRRVDPQIPKEHWARIKALSRRYAERTADEYAGLRPVADLHQQLTTQLYRFVQHPLAWEPLAPAPEVQKEILDAFQQELGRRVRAEVGRRLFEERAREWQHAYAQRGSGSTTRRATIMIEEMFEDAAIGRRQLAPTPGSFASAVDELVTAAATACGVNLRQAVA